MKLTTTNTTMQITRVVDIADGPVLAQLYSTAGRRYRVERVTVTYEWNAEKQEWAAPSWSSVKMSGTVLKKDGSDSKNWHEDRPEWDWRTRQYIPEHVFIREIIDLLRPNGDVGMTVLNGYEVEA